MSYDNTNSGTLGKNRYKEKDNQPDITGSIKNVTDEAIELIRKTRTIQQAFWTRTSKDGGERFLSGGLDMHYMRKLAAENEAPDVPKPAKETGGGSFDDSIPFAKVPSWP